MKVCSLAPLALAVSCSIGLLTGCSSSGSSSNESSITGSIVAAPVNGAQVSVIDANGNIVAGPVNTNIKGEYALTIPDSSLSQDLIVKSTGGTFIDEASGSNAIATEMFVYASANSISSGSKLSATPGSTIIAKLVMNHNKTMIQAQEIFKNAFGYTPDISVIPVDAMKASADASDAEKLSGFRAAAFSQLAKDIGLSQNDQFEMFAALAQDLSDDVLDGVDSLGEVNIGSTGFNLEADIQNRFALALINFKANANNLTDLDNSKIGNVPFAKTALTNTYKIEYVQMGMMDAMEGKSNFKIRITNRSSGAPETALTPILMPMMHMATMNHTSPKAVNSVVNNGDGDYLVTLYYLMASQMMDGMSMGYWDLKFTVANEEAHFYPTVMMAMGDTAKTRLKGQADVIKDMQGNDVSRDYFIFKDTLTGTGPYTLTLFVAAKESMMSFPALVNPDTLASGMGGAPLSVSSVSVNVTDNSGTPVAASDNSDGTWTINNLSLNNGLANQLEVELRINGERKTSDGTAGGVNSMFTITPVSM